ncbi:MAG: RagB/SusD family nutrient uptake outer membrane protein [Tannerellaceae bacterium]|jgi:hypothetical protein|nr:RagB/SusD family nutrient uptake outer membrane protein [Tannerellaceae bacterium]
MKAPKYIILTLIAALFASCSDFLNVNPSTSVADTEVFQTVSGAQAALNGCYRQMITYGAGGANRQDDYGIPSIIHISDMCGEDIIGWGGWYTYVYNYWGETRADIFRSSQLWTYHYRLINNVNGILTNIDACDGDAIQKKYIKGQALAMRGWAYFSLARLFQQTYAIAKQMPGVPIYLEPTNDTTQGKARGTLAETYTQVLADLNEAEQLLDGFSRGSSANINHFDRRVVEGVLAQVYQVMNNWPKAEEYAMRLVDTYPLTTNEQYLEGFNNENTASWIWGMRQTEDQNMGDYSQFAMWGNEGRKCFSFYGWFLPNDFVELFEEDDIRYQFEWWWEQIWASNKFRDNDDCRGSYCFMRTEEMQLNAAEAMARQGKDAQARELLNELRELRHATLSASSGNDLIEDILIERRKELYGEGHALFDMLRNQKPLLRTGNHANYNGSFQLPARSWRFIFQIPRSEMLNNKALVDDIWPDGDQNPYSGVYEASGL